MAQGTELAALIKVLTILREEVDNEIPIQMAHTFLCVALRPGISMQDLCRDTGLSQSSASRNVQTLGKWHRIGKPGYDVVEAVDDPADTRRKIMFLTPKGRSVIGKVLGAAFNRDPAPFDAPSSQEYLAPVYRARMSR